MVVVSLALRLLRERGRRLSRVPPLLNDTLGDTASVLSAIAINRPAIFTLLIALSYVNTKSKPCLTLLVVSFAIWAGIVFGGRDSLQLVGFVPKLDVQEIGGVQWLKTGDERGEV